MLFENVQKPNVKEGRLFTVILWKIVVLKPMSGFWKIFAAEYKNTP